LCQRQSRHHAAGDSTGHPAGAPDAWRSLRRLVQRWWLRSSGIGPQNCAPVSYAAWRTRAVQGHCTARLIPRGDLRRDECLGRTGKMFAAEHWGVVPDIMTLAKGLSSGYAPIAATVCRTHIARQFDSAQGKALAHLLTFGGQAVACAAALANLDIIVQEQLVE